jgi:hypothetical protein
MATSHTLKDILADVTLALLCIEGKNVELCTVVPT